MLLASAALITVEIILRRLFETSIIGVIEIVGYAFAVAMAWGFAYGLFVRSHIRVDVLYLQFPDRVQRWLDVVALAAFAGIISLVVLKAAGTLIETLRLDAHASTPLSAPLWIPQTLWLSGLTFFLVCMLLRLFDLARAVIRGEWELALRLGGPESLVSREDS